MTTTTTQKELIVIIAGGRDFDDFSFLEKSCYKSLASYLERGYKIIIRSGHAKGADSLGEIFAKENNFDLQIYKPDWFLYGKRAGIIRNCQMAKDKDEDKPANMLIAFWDGKSKGTQHMIKTMYENPFATICIYNY